MSDQKKQDEYERTFNLSGSEPQNKMVSLDHILFQIEQYCRRISGYDIRHVYARDAVQKLKEYLIEQNT
jgi:hypothetical protein